MELVQLSVFVVSAFICLVGATGVVRSRNPVHAALSLVATLFGIAVLFVQQSAHFLAAVQVIVYTGAIVVLIMFVIMLLGVDRDEDLDEEPLVGQRVMAGALAGALGMGLLVMFLFKANGQSLVTGKQAQTQALSIAQAADPSQSVAATADGNNVEVLGRLLFTDYVFAFEVTAVLLTIAVIGAVVMAKKPTKLQPLPDAPASVADDFMADIEAGGDH